MKWALAFASLMVSLPALADGEAGERYSASKLYMDVRYGDVESLKAKEGSETPAPGQELTLFGNVGIARLVKFKTQTNYFVVDYSQRTPILPVLNMGFGSSLYSYRAFNLSWFAAMGFATSQSTRAAISRGGTHVQDSISLQWVPLVSGTKAEISTMGGKVVPHGHFGLGGNYLLQSGTLDGMDRSVWIPMISAGVGVRLFGNESKAGAFEGVDFGLDVLQGGMSDHEVSVFELKVGTNVSI